MAAIGVRRGGRAARNVMRGRSRKRRPCKREGKRRGGGGHTPRAVAISGKEAVATACRGSTRYQWWLAVVVAAADSGGGNRDGS